MLPETIRAAAEAIRRRHGFWHKLVPTDRLHQTLVVSCDFDVRQPQLVSQVVAAMDGLRLGACTVSFDVLCCADGWAGFASQRRQSDLIYVQHCLERCLAAVGFPTRRSFRFSPHVTLAYGHCAGPVLRIPPIVWTPDEVVLIESWVGRTQHHILGRWPLGTGVVPSQQELAF